MLQNKILSYFWPNYIVSFSFSFFFLSLFDCENVTTRAHYWMLSNICSAILRHLYEEEKFEIEQLKTMEKKKCWGRRDEKMEKNDKKKNLGTRKEN